MLLSPGQWNPPEQPRLALRLGLVLVAMLSVGIAVWFTTAGASVREVVERSLRPESARTPASAASRTLGVPSSPSTQPSSGPAEPPIPTAPRLPTAPLLPSTTPVRAHLGDVVR